MKISQLLKARDALVRQASFANLAFAYEVLGDFANRIARAGIVGHVNLKTADVSVERYWATLTPLEGSQSVIQEHFTDEDLTDFTDAIAYATGRDHFELQFQIEDFSDIFLTPLRHALEQAGIEIDQAPARIEERASNDNA